MAYYDDFDHEIPGTAGRTIVWEGHTYTLAENIHYGYDPDEVKAYEDGERWTLPSVTPSAALVFPGLTDEEQSDGLVVFEAGWDFDSPAEVEAWDAANLQEHLWGVIYDDDRHGHDDSVLPDFGKEEHNEQEP